MNPSSMRDPRIDRIYQLSEQRYPERVAVALIEGLPALARIALVARAARRAQQFFTVKDESARYAIELANRAAEKAASGEPITEAEVLSARDQAVLGASDAARREGLEAAREAASVSRLAANCLRCPEIAYGEMACLAGMRVPQAAGLASRVAGIDSMKKIHEMNEALGNDLERMLLFVETSGDQWVDPEMEKPTDARNDRGWKSMLDSAGIGRFGSDGDVRQRWKCIHEAIRQTGGHFYAPTIFSPL